MRNAQKLSDWQEQEKNKIRLDPCIVCGNMPKEGYYGRYGDGGTCSKTCEAVQNKKPLYPDHSEEDFLRRHYASLSETEVE